MKRKKKGGEESEQEHIWWRKEERQQREAFLDMESENEKRICLSAYSLRSFNFICFDLTCVPTNHFLTIVHACLVVNYFSHYIPSSTKTLLST